MPSFSATNSFVRAMFAARSLGVADQASGWKADLIVIGTHGRSGLIDKVKASFTTEAPTARTIAAAGGNGRLELLRADADRLMVEHAGALAANAIIGVRYDANEIAPGVTEVLAYGTAVVIEANSSKLLSADSAVWILKSSSWPGCVR